MILFVCGFLSLDFCEWIFFLEGMVWRDVYIS